MPIDPSIDRVAPTRVTVLIDGGSEEERTAVARALHDRSPRRHEPFTTIDCAASAHHEMERLLGGTASQRATRVTGLGTLCVSNVDAMPRWLQPRFLGFLDGGGRPRIVVSARVDLAAAREGRFWPDLSERLFLVRIAIVAGEGEMADFGAGGRFGVRGALDAEHRAALRLLSMVALRISDDGAPVTEEEVAVDTVLPGFVAAAPATRRLKAEVAQLSRSSATILIDGESGSGKEVVARAVHDLSTRSQRPYVVFNCASIPRDLFESQLFGHRRGSFTGATGDNLGVVRAADGGTLFLDEIGELPLEMQPKLLRFLENGEVLPIGETKARRVDVRVIAATHRDPVALVREGRFREDLFYRLNVIPLRVPPLRDRKEDVLALARLFISRLVPEGTDPPHLGADAVTALMAHRWPGNVRELRNLVERAMAYAPIPRVLHARDLRIDERSS